MNIALAESPNISTSGDDTRYDDVKAFYYRPDIVYTCPGANDFIVVWENGIKKKCQKHYLTLYLREAFFIFKEFFPNIEIGFSKFCSLRPKNVLLMKDTPSDQCKCLTHENFIFKLKGLKQNYCNDWWTMILCDPSLDSKCWKNECDTCSDGKKILISMDLSTICVWKEWEKNSENKLRLVNHETSSDELKEKLIDSIHIMMKHVNLKRVQAGEFQKDQRNENVRILQVDFAMSFGCEYQNEVQSALWSRTSVLLFTAASFYKGNCQTYLICSDANSKDKDTVFVFINKLFDLMHKENEDLLSAEIIWSDGPSSEFKNRYMVKLTSMLSEKYKRYFYWKYFATSTSHGKGVIDGVGGNIKRLVREKMMSQNEHVVVQSAKDFSDLASQLVTKTRVIYVPSSEIYERIKSASPWDNAKAITGVSNFHFIKTEEKVVECRKHCLSQDKTVFTY